MSDSYRMWTATYTIDGFDREFTTTVFKVPQYFRVDDAASAAQVAFDTIPQMHASVDWDARFSATSGDSDMGIKITKLTERVFRTDCISIKDHTSW
jgi:hypothetical protein